ncbi:MarR family winged helix-turn-helix transcriptional regulator [Chitinophaga sp. GCM10012297]|uniref:MarR family transcriptional regulator n=1 Tax=Chitinophaga chungangae TaxID=2821488 RepID=A0ABS3YCB9_9BACT|nr:MarR family transcriptional regulator [Chitinophaga chungangae]MBO9152110.1 MarR family transcriptional regulator [Chitinophaga chungangae]
MSIVNQLEELALATRLKRLADRLSADVSRVYKESELDFEAKWFLILELLSREKVLGITEISDSLGISHPAVVQLADQMLGQGLIKASVDEKDARRRLISLTPAGKQMHKKIGPMLEIIREENRKWLASAEHNLLAVLSELETSLDEKSMYKRIKMALLDRTER